MQLSNTLRQLKYSRAINRSFAYSYRLNHAHPQRQFITSSRLLKSTHENTKAGGEVCYTSAQEQLKQGVENSSDFPSIVSKLSTDTQVAFVSEMLRNQPQSVLNKLSEEEVRTIVIAANSKHFETDFETEFAEADLDNDGHINKTEFKRYLFTLGARDRDEQEIATVTVDGRQKAIYGLNCAVPMIVFGLLDNSIMIIGGDVVDDWIGSSFQLSTLACAALANTFADVFGISIGNTVEKYTGRIGIPQAKLTNVQTELPVMKRISMASASLGILLGCLLGMFPLLFIDNDNTMLKPVFESLDADGTGRLTAQEICTGLNKAGIKANQEQIQNLIDDNDENSDGKLNFAEFVQLFKKLKSTGVQLD